MKILYDHQMFSRQKYGGITKYFVELMKHLPSEHKYKLGVLFSNNQHLKDNFNTFKKVYIPIPEKSSRYRGHIISKTYQINSFYSERLISKSNFDLFHPTYFDDYFLKKLGNKPYVTTVHDMIEFKFKKNNKISFIPQMERIIKNATRIIAISENTQKDLVEILNINPQKIDVIYHGYEKKTNKESPNHFGRYILYVGERAGYKNFSTFLRSFKELTLKDDDIKLVCVGSPFSKQELNELNETGVSKNIFCLGVDEPSLHALYKNALAFVYPSLYEGFGMPILEAFANDCPVCLSDTSCFPEIAGNAGIYFNPIEPEDIVDKIQKVIYDSNFSKLAVNKGRERLKFFSWDKCAYETTNAYIKTVSY